MSEQRSATAKRISTFQPLAAADVEECDRYYREVHSRFARGFLREMDNVISYHVGRAVAGHDLNGGWLARPETFRFITLRFRPGSGLEMSPQLRDTISQDHRLFLRELRSFTVAEEVLVDRLARQTALVKYVFYYDRQEGEDPRKARTGLAAQLEALSALAEQAFGLRLLISNRVVSEARSEPIDEPGQRMTADQLSDTRRQAFVEFYFDQAHWAEEWFLRHDVQAALTGNGWGKATGMRVLEECGLDRR